MQTEELLSRVYREHRSFTEREVIFPYRKNTWLWLLVEVVFVIHDWKTLRLSPKRATYWFKCATVKATRETSIRKRPKAISCLNHWWYTKKSDSCSWDMANCQCLPTEKHKLRHFFNSRCVPKVRQESKVPSQLYQVCQILPASRASPTRVHYSNSPNRGGRYDCYSTSQETNCEDQLPDTLGERETLVAVLTIENSKFGSRCFVVFNFLFGEGISWTGFFLGGERGWEGSLGSMGSYVFQSYSKCK